MNDERHRQQVERVAQFYKARAQRRLVGEGRTVKCLINSALILLIVYIAVCGAAWKIRNPLGNDSTFWIYFPKPLIFGRVPELQVQRVGGEVGK